MGTGVTYNRSSIRGGEEGTKRELMMVEQNLTLISCEASCDSYVT